VSRISDVTTQETGLSPIAVMAFNRPALLKPVLESLRAQQGAAIEARAIHLFQDGAVNKYSRMRYAEDADIAGSIAVFQSVFPNGIVHASPQNIGVCENFLRAEEFLFTEQNAECAYFFEDDMVLSPAYLAMMDRLQWYSRGARMVAYFAAYGDYYASPEEIAARRDQCITLDHHWGFGLFRHHWSRIRNQLEDYYAIVLGTDYSRRDHHAIYDMYRKLGACPRGSSQDAAKAFFAAQLGLWRVRTVQPFARYTGKEGAHMSAEQFDALGFDRTIIATEPLERLSFPSEDDMREAVAAQQQLFVHILKNEIETLAAGLGRKLNPMRPATAADITAMYQLLLHRQPENAAIIAGYTNRPVFEVVRALLRSGEYEKLTAKIEP
jgi:hypothetical protein